MSISKSKSLKKIHLKIRKERAVNSFFPEVWKYQDQIAPGFMEMGLKALPRCKEHVPRAHMWVWFRCTGGTSVAEQLALCAEFQTVSLAVQGLG